MTKQEKREQLDEIYSELSYCKNKYLTRTNDLNILTTLDPTLREFVFEEFKRCIDDIEYFASEYINRSLTDEQLLLTGLFHRFKDVGVNIDRLKGKTFTLLIYVLHEACFTIDRKIAYLTPKYAQSLDFINQFKKLFESLPKWLKPSVNTWCKSQVDLNNGFHIVGGSLHSDSCIGHPIDTLIADNIDCIEEMVLEELMMGIYPTLTCGKDHRFIYTYTHNDGLNSDFIKERQKLPSEHFAFYKGV